MLRKTRLLPLLLKKKLLESIDVHNGRLMPLKTRQDISDPIRLLLDKPRHAQVLMPKWSHGVPVVFAFDDFCARSKTNSRYDYGGEPSKGVNKIIIGLVKKYPFLKGTLFTIPSPITADEGWVPEQILDGEKFRLDNHRNLVQWITSEEFTQNFEIAMHGVHHYQKKKPYNTTHEFEFMSKPQAKKSIVYGLDIFARSSITVRGFKAPAWAVGHNANFGVVDALKELKFDYICLASPTYGLNMDITRVSNIYPSLYEGMTHLPTNIFLTEDISTILKKIDLIYERQGVISIQGHYAECSRLPDGLCSLTVEKIDSIMRFLEHKQVSYQTMSELAFFLRRQKVRN